MKYKSLRMFMKKKNLDRPYSYAGKPLVIDGQCFKDLYKKSGSLFILGGEYDRFASYLRSVFSNYIKCNIECYVIFNGAMKADIERRKQIHQNIIDKVDAITPNGDNEYCEPIFVKDVWKDVLDELGIKYHVAMYDSKAVLFSLAKRLNCPILTNNIEYALYGVTVIAYKSVVFNKETKSISCSIYHETLCRRWNSFSNDIMSLALTIADEDSKFYKEMLEIFQCREGNFISTIFYWIRRQSKDSVIKFMKSHLKEENKQAFLDTFAEVASLITVSSKTPVAVAIANGKETRPRNDDEWFEQAVGSGIVAIQFINLKNAGFLSGSWVVNDKNREDAMLPAVDIALYVQGLLKRTKDVQVCFIGRKKSLSSVSVIKKQINLQNRRGKRGFATKTGVDFNDFTYFISDQLPGFNLTALESVPEDCWLLLISLLYYSNKVKHAFMLEVYCIILSYVLLGPVSEKVGVIIRSNFSLTHGIVEENEEAAEEPRSGMSDDSLTREQCMQAAIAVVDFFYPPRARLRDFDRHAIHTFAEFQHCLQFMNYLNKLCGEPVKCTSYQKTINCTFMYNLFDALLKVEISPEDYIENLLNCRAVFKYFKKILNCYFHCSSLISDYLFEIFNN